MQNPENARTKGGAPRKAPGGLNIQLMVRVDESLNTKLRQLQAHLNAGSPGRTPLAIADIIRMTLWAEIKRVLGDS